MKPKKAEVIKLLTKREKIIYLIHCTCGNYHVCIQHSKDSFEIVDTAKSKKQGELLYQKNMAEIELKVKGYKCERCGHEWQPRKEDYPRTCPSCKSPYWDKPRKNKEKKKNDNKS